MGLLSVQAGTGCLTKEQVAYWQLATDGRGGSPNIQSVCVHFLSAAVWDRRISSAACRLT